MAGIVAVLDRERRSPIDAILDGLSRSGTERAWTWHDPTRTVTLGQSSPTPGTSAIDAIDGNEHVAILDGHILGVDGLASAASGSEVVPDCYRRWGDSLSSHLDGAFAFLVWDRRRHRLIGGCDVTGRRTFAFHARG